jgi:hypothetical protein
MRQRGWHVAFRALTEFSAQHYPLLVQTINITLMVMKN